MVPLGRGYRRLGCGQGGLDVEDAFPPGRLPLGAWVRLAPFRKLVVSVCRA